MGLAIFIGKANLIWDGFAILGVYRIQLEECTSSRVSCLARVSHKSLIGCLQE